MSNKKLVERKKKKKEAKAKETVLHKREKIRERAKTEKKIAKAEKKTRTKLVPYVRPVIKPEYDEQIMAQLQRNIEILEALEQEYLKEQADKKALNEQLEAEGHHTLGDKMEALNIKTRIWAEQNPEVQQPGATSIVEVVQEAHDDPLQQISS